MNVFTTAQRDTGSVCVCVCVCVCVLSALSAVRFCASASLTDIAADDKDFAVRIEVEEEEGMYTEAGIMGFLKDNTWMGLGPSKDEL